MTEATGLKKTLRGREIIKNASFKIGDGETVAIAGDSGTGKTTIVRMLCGIIPPDGGKIFLDGKLIAAPGRPYDRKTGRAIQPVYQQPHAALDPSQRIGDGLEELIRHLGIATAGGAKKTAAEALASVGLGESILGKLPHQISGGEAQRVCLAKCLLFRPRLLILDEATSMLDVSTQANVMALVRRTALRDGGSILLISHDMELTEHMSDRIYRLDDGFLKEEK